jgi:hypothetical protein
MDEELEQRIREKAFHLWIEEGQPDGRAEDNWSLAKELIAIEDGQMATTRPVSREKAGEPVEEADILENLGEFPTMTDQGEQQVPHRAIEKSNDANAHHSLTEAEITSEAFGHWRAACSQPVSYLAEIGSQVLSQISSAQRPSSPKEG